MSNNKQWGIALCVIGALFLIGAAFAYGYQKTERTTIPGVSVGDIQILQPTYYDRSTTPYRDSCVPLALLGVAAFFVGLTLVVSDLNSKNSQLPESSSQSAQMEWTI